jgi:hypothetical protein
MALNKMVKKLNLESEEIDVSEVEDQTIEDVVEADINIAELQEATKELEDIQEDFEEGEATAAELQEAIDHTKEVIAKVEEAAEEGKEVEVPVEEVVAAQESLKYFYSKIGFDNSDMVTVSREDIATGSLEAYKNLSANLEQLQVNLEGVMGDMAAKIKEVAKKIGTKLLSILGNIKATSEVLLKEIQPLDGVIANDANIAFVNKYKKLGYNAEMYGNSILPIVNELIAAHTAEIKAIAENKPFTEKMVKASKYAKYVTGIKGTIAVAYAKDNGKLRYEVAEDTPAGTVLEEADASAKELKEIKLSKADAIKFLTIMAKERDLVYDKMETLDKMALALEGKVADDNRAFLSYATACEAIHAIVDANYSFVKKYAVAILKALKASK